MHSLTDLAPTQPYRPPAVVPPDGTLYLQALQALRNGEAEEAISLMTRALRWQPTHQGMRRNLVRALLLAERFEQVMLQANAALKATPDDAELHFARGTALNALGQSSLACAAFARALSLRPNHAASWLNMGNASADLGDLASAEKLYRTAIDLDAALPEAQASLGYLLTVQGRLKEAIAACEAAIRLRPDFAQAHWNLAIAALLGGDLHLGFTEYEWRKRHARFGADFANLPGPIWDGTALNGRTILIRAEQGFGDAIQFARYLPLIRARGGNPVLVCAPSLVPLFQSFQAVSSTDKLPAYDAWIDQISLPRVFNTTLDSIPAAHGYLGADPDRVETWRRRLPDGPKVGLAWAGNPKHSGDQRRSIPGDAVRLLTDKQNVRFINLQFGAAARGLGLPDLTEWMTDYAETAALIETLDLIVTVDTSVAHLAGAMGKPVWIMLPHAPDWRWLLNRTDSPWYRSARLFRQPTAGDWTSVLAEVAGALSQRV